MFALSRYPFEYLEGVLFDAARRIGEGAPLYCDLHHIPCVLLPHPPVYVGLVAGLAKVFGLSVQLGRLLSFASLVGTLGVLYALARLQTSRRIALLAPALYLIFIEVGYFSALMRPEALALLLELSAILIVLKRPGTAGSMIGALLIVAALFTKPNMLAGPLALTLILMKKNRGQFAVFAVAGVIGTAAVLVIGDWWSGGYFIRNHVLSHTARIYTWTQFFRILFYGALPWVPILLAAVALAVREWRRRQIDFPLVYFAIAFVWCLSSASLQGSAAYYYLELYAATGLLFATRLEALAAEWDTGAALPRFVRGALCAQLGLSLVVNPIISGERYTSYLRLWRDAPTFVSELQSAPGMILVEDPIAAAAIQRPLLAEIFMNSQAARNGTWDQKPLLDLLNDGGISRVVLRDAPLDRATWLQRERFTPEMLAAIVRNYRLTWSGGDWYVYSYRGDAALTGAF